MKEMFRMVDKSKVDEVKQMLEYTQKGTAKATVGNYMVVLRNDPLVRESMKYNKLTGRIDIVKNAYRLNAASHNILRKSDLLDT